MKKSFKKIISLFLIIGMNWSAISLIAGTDAYFNDVEMSENNTLTAGVLDFKLEGNGFHAYDFTQSQTQIERIELINNEDNLDFEYSVSASIIVNEDSFCDDLVLSVDLNNANIYNGSLSGLENDPDASDILAPLFGSPHQWDFQITSGSSAAGTCKFDFVFEGQQENLNYGSGFFDEEKVGNIVSTETNFGPADHVVINEVYSNAGDESNSEWIELYNPTDEIAYIEEWIIDTSSYQPDIIIPSGAEIPPYHFYLIGDNGWTPDNSNWPSPDYYGEEMTLNNSNGWVILKDQNSGVIDTVGWGSSAMNFETVPYPNNPPANQSIERGLNGYDDNDNSADFTIKTNPTPTNSNGDGMPEIVINEFLASGNVYNDFVEIYNGSDSTTLGSGWGIKVDSGTIETFNYDLTPGEFTVIEMDLNENGVIALYDDNSNEIDKISYYGADAIDSSFARIPDGSPNWVDPIPTPGGTNEIYENLIIAGLDDLIEGNGGSIPQIISFVPEPIIPEPISEPEDDEPEDDDTIDNADDNGDVEDNDATDDDVVDDDDTDDTDEDTNTGDDDTDTDGDTDDTVDGDIDTDDGETAADTTDDDTGDTDDAVSDDDTDDDTTDDTDDTTGDTDDADKDRSDDDIVGGDTDADDAAGDDVDTDDTKDDDGATDDIGDDYTTDTGADAGDADVGDEEKADKEEKPETGEEEDDGSEEQDGEDDGGK